MEKILYTVKEENEENNVVKVNDNSIKLHIRLMIIILQLQTRKLRGKIYTWNSKN